MTRKRLVVATLGVALLAVAIILVGRWEQQRSAQQQMAEMRKVLAAVGPLDRAVPTGVRIDNPSCLAYSVPQNRLGLQLCFDNSGRLVETVDRRPAQPVYASLAYDPSLSTIRLSPKFVRGLFTYATGG
jgi:hypothetical protein